MGAVAPMANLAGVPEAREGEDQRRAARMHRSLIDGFLQRVIDEEGVRRVAWDLQITGWRPGHKSLCRQIEVPVSAKLHGANKSPTQSTNAFANPSVLGVRCCIRMRTPPSGVRMFDLFTEEPQGAQGCGLDGGAPPCGRSGEAQPKPRVVTTGRKKADRPAVVVERYYDTGERVEVTSSGDRGVCITRYLDPIETAPADCALIDALAFSVVPPDEKSYPWVLEQMQQFLPIETIEYRKGLFGFRYSARIGEGVGVIAWGGESQRGRVFFSLMGQGCSMVKDWPVLQAWLESHRAVLKRADVAYDDHKGKLVNIAWAVEQYKGGGFNAGGRKPRAECFGDWLDGDESTKGRTVGIGSRVSGKYARCYEKGKQLGDPTSPWTRIEVEWRAQDRHIPYDILTKPGQYLAGAYPCLAALNERQSSIKTVTKAARIAYDRAVENAKLHCGKIVNLMLAVEGGDYGEVVSQLIRPGIPTRIEPFSYHVRQDPLMLDQSARGAPA
jgi:phage replication initiation protein